MMWLGTKLLGPNTFVLKQWRYCFVSLPWLGPYQTGLGFPLCRNTWCSARVLVAFSYHWKWKQSGTRSFFLSLVFPWETGTLSGQGRFSSPFLYSLSQLSCEISICALILWNLYNILTSEKDKIVSILEEFVKFALCHWLFFLYGRIHIYIF